MEKHKKENSIKNELLQTKKHIKKNSLKIKSIKLEKKAPKDKIVKKEDIEKNKLENEVINVKFDNKKENKFIKFFKTFNLYEIIWFSSVVVLTIFLAVFLPDLVLEDSTTPFIVICSVIAIIANPACELLISKQSKWNFIVSIVFIEVSEMFIYFSLGYYSSALVSLLFWVPIDIFSFVNWFEHKDEKQEELTKVKRLSWKQDILVIMGIAVFSFVIGYILQFVGGEDTYLDAFVSAVGMTNGILLLLRYNEQWYAWFTYLIFDAVLWILSGHLIMLITTIAMMTNTVYGFFKWLKYIKTHKKEIKSSTVLEKN